MTGRPHALGPGLQRGLGLAWLLLAGIASLPLTAIPLDGRGTENLIVPVQLIAMMAIGAATVALLPALAPAGASRRKALLLGAALGVGAAFVGVVLFWLLINGLSGA